MMDSEIVPDEKLSSNAYPCKWKLCVFCANPTENGEASTQPDTETFMKGISIICDNLNIQRACKFSTAEHWALDGVENFVSFVCCWQCYDIVDKLASLHLLLLQTQTSLNANVRKIEDFILQSKKRIEGKNCEYSFNACVQFRNEILQSLAQLNQNDQKRSTPKPKHQQCNGLAVPVDAESTGNGPSSDQKLRLPLLLPKAYVRLERLTLPIQKKGDEDGSICIQNVRAVDKGVNDNDEGGTNYDQEAENSSGINSDPDWNEDSEYDAATTCSESRENKESEDESNTTKLKCSKQRKTSRNKIKCHTCHRNDKIRPFKCDICDKRFTRKNTVFMHKERVHNIPFPPRPVKLFTCDICSKKFGRKGTLKRHKINIHGGKGGSVQINHEVTQKIEAPDQESSLTQSHEDEDENLDISETPDSPENEEKPSVEEDTQTKGYVRDAKSGIYTCETCGKHCRTTRGISKHLLDLHGITMIDMVRPFKCDVCSQAFTRKFYLQHHQEIRHKIHRPPPPLRPYTCDICKKKFKLRCTVSKHMKKLHGIILTFRGGNHSTDYEKFPKEQYHPRKGESKPKRYACTRCSNSYDGKYFLQLHMLKTHNEMPTYGCHQCHLEFRTRRLLHHHVYEAHKKDKMTVSFMNRIKSAKCNDATDEINEACVVCGVHFASWIALRNHLDHHEKNLKMEEKNRKCYFCWQSFAYEQSIWAHLQSCRHHDFTKIEFGCDHPEHLGLSRWAYKTPAELEQHFKDAHVECTIMRCEECGSKFLDKNMMDLHRLVHLPRINGKRRCPSCHNFFLHDDSLRNHYNIEHGVKLRLYRCEICRWGFSAKNGYTSHLKSHAEENKGGLEGEQLQEFVCSKCPKSYPTAIQLRDHTRSIHVMKQCEECGIMIKRSRLSYHIRMNHCGDGSHLCPVCGKRYKLATALKKHMCNHGEYVCYCPFCKKGYATGSLLRRHIRREHKGRDINEEQGENDVGEGITNSDSNIIHTTCLQ